MIIPYLPAFTCPDNTIIQEVLRDPSGKPILTEDGLYQIDAEATKAAYEAATGS